MSSRAQRGDLKVKETGSYIGLPRVTAQGDI
jgi:hypothetical protein